MDTVRIAINDSFFVARVFRRIKSLGLDIRGRDPDRGIFKQPRGYRLCFHSHVNGHSLYIAYEPKSPNVPDAEICFHLSGFTTARELMAWLKFVFADDYETIIKGKLIRLDLCIDIGLPYETIQNSVKQAGAVRVERWTSIEGRTLYLGKPPRFTRVYEKKISRDRLDFRAPFNTENEPVEATRIEVQLERYKVPIENLSQLSQLYHINPFSHLDLNTTKNDLINTSAAKSSYIVNAFLRRLEQVGYAAAHKEFNKHGNFNKTISPYIGKLDLDLHKAWIARLDRLDIQAFIPSIKAVI